MWCWRVSIPTFCVVSMLWCRRGLNANELLSRERKVVCRRVFDEEDIHGTKDDDRNVVQLLERVKKL